MEKKVLKSKWPYLVILSIFLVVFTHCDQILPKTQSEINLVEVEGERVPTSNSSSTGGSTGSTNNGQTYFQNTLLPAIQQSCTTCHAPIVDNPIIEAPLSIISYASSRAMLLDGTSANNNRFYNKASNTVGHSGGNQCSNSNNVCDLIQQWYVQETGGSGVTTGAVRGEVQAVSMTGVITGWAADPENAGDSLDIEIFVGGDSNSGQFVGRTVASLSGFNGGVSGNHAFRYEIPSQYKDGNTYSFYVYALDGNNYVSLTNSPSSHAFFEASANGRQFFASTVKPVLDQRCSSCHVVSHDQFFNSLITPTPNNGGSATNNEMVRMPAGSYNGRGHPGGNICGTINNSPCSLIQQWWSEEFGN